MKKKIKYLLDSIDDEYIYTQGMTGKSNLDPVVRDAIANTPREQFVPKAYLDSAFDNRPLPIGYEQTISQPYIVALMTDLLSLKQDDIVLEIGTGSGYQTAILSQLCKQVFTIEYVAELADIAKARLKKQGYENIESICGNGFDGWPEHAPYDGIIVTAAATRIPQPLIDQLKPGGRMIIPVGSPYQYQELILVTKGEKGEIEQKAVLGVAFVPLQGEPYD
jgi:protein-L-isoaspartate(D-aspartate) O-methyltransferase